MPDFVSLITCYYNQPKMLGRQLQCWSEYPEPVRQRFRIIIVDDASQSPAEPIIRASGLPVELYRIDQDIPWNMHGACNLGAHVGEGWLLRIDIDHVLLAAEAQRLLDFRPKPKVWYRFNREWAKPSADGYETGWRKPHVNSFLLHRDLYWRAGGYDEDYAGIYTGDTDFHENLNRAGKLGAIPITLRTYADVEDSSTPGLSRGPEQKEMATRVRRAKVRRGATRATNPLRFPWHRVL